MNYSTKLLVFSSFLLIALALTKPSIAADLEVDASKSLLDIDGNILRADTEYYILPALRGGGGGITMAGIGDELCPLSVVQDPFEVLKGLPVTFTPWHNYTIPSLSTDLNIKFSAFSVCAQSTVWKIQNSTNSEIQWSVTTGAVEGNPGCETVTNWFKIEPTGNDYKLTYCPTVCDDFGGLCRDIGIYIDSNGNRILSLSDKLPTFLVRFQQASSLSASI